VPHGTDFSDLRPLLPVFLSYALSFTYLGIYWNNHHMLQAIRQVNGRILWANLHLLFWLSLVPFATGWMGENHLAPLPAAPYGAVLFMAGMAYMILERELIAHHGKESALATAVGTNWKAKFSISAYAAAIVLCAVKSWVALVIYALVAALWFVPDRRIEKMLTS
jgi:uncharacterized membrane protein